MAARVPSKHAVGVRIPRLAPSSIRCRLPYERANGSRLVRRVIMSSRFLSLPLPSGWGARVAFSPDGARLAVASTDTSVHVYLLHVADLVNVARTRLSR